MRKTLLPALALALLGCGSEPSVEPTAPAAARTTPRHGPQPTSLLGEPLPPVELPEEFRKRQRKLLQQARVDLEREPEEPDNWIWAGRRSAYLGRYGQAIAIYTRAIARFPEDPRLYRHRGHRFLTTRDLDAAIDDLARAVLLSRGSPDQTEPDGLPNERGVPTSTLQSNIWYHLGLAHYLKGDFESALAAYRECLEVSTNPDMLVATSYWLYLTLARLDLRDEAADVLESVTPDLDVIENHDYLQLLLSFRGLVDAHGMWEKASQNPAATSYATIGYGLGAYHLLGGRDEKARQWFERVLETPGWAAFGYIAAEAELARW